MAQAIQKITLSAARDIPFNKLTLSQQNVRKIKAGVSIEDLAQDIVHRGLLSSLNVRAELDADGKETGIYRVPAGGRRYRALELLVSQKRLAKTAGVPCIVSAGETSEVEDSLAENAQRVNLHPLDQYRAFQALRDQGIDEETIADRFFVSIQIVRQRLRLASVSPHLLELYANDEMSREQVMAFSITNDHVRQEQVWEAVSRSQMTEARYIRRLLTETSVRASDRRAVYVGIDAYEAAGGVVMRDLFEQDGGGWLQDPATLEQLVFEKLKADAEALKTEEGWKWVEAALDFPYNHSAGLRRFYGEQVEITQAELDRHDALRAEYEALDAAYAEAEDYSEETERRLEELGAEIDKLSDRPYVFKPEDVACGGAFVSLAANGELRIERGFVRPEDEPQIDTADVDTVNSEADDSEMPASSSASGISVNGQTVSNEEAEQEDDTIRPLPDRLVIDLTAARSVAMRNALANDPLIAFIAVLHAFVLKTFYLDTADSCLELTLQSATFSQTPGLSDTVWAREIDQRRQAWGQDLPKSSHDLWDFLIALDEVSRQALFAHCASLSLNAVIEPWRRRPGAMTHVEQVARSIGFDMVGAGWAPTVDNYLGRVTKAHILQAVREARDERSVQLIDHLRKADMAREAERLLADTGWIPELLRFSANETSADASETANAESDVDHSGDDAAVGDLPAFLIDEEAIIDFSGDTDEDGEQQHLDAAE